MYEGQQLAPSPLGQVTGGLSAADSNKREPAIHVALVSQDTAIQQLEGAIENLYHRLSSLLRQEPVAADGKPEGNLNLPPIVEAIQSHANRVATANRAIRDIINRLEV